MDYPGPFWQRSLIGHAFPLASVYKRGRYLPNIYTLLCRNALKSAVPTLNRRAVGIKLSSFPNQFAKIVEDLHLPLFDLCSLGFESIQLAVGACRHKGGWQVNIAQEFDDNGLRDRSHATTGCVGRCHSYFERRFFVIVMML